MRVPLLLLTALLALGGCDRAGGDAPIRVSVIGPAPDEAPRFGARGAPDAVLASATGLGLVRLDEDGQPIAGLAIRWALYDEGRDAIFRIDEQARPAAPGIARALRRALAPDARPNLLPGLRQPARIEAVTDSVIELRLADARPDLLALLAAPELAGLRRDGGPYSVAGSGPGRLMLRARRSDTPDPPTPIVLRGEHAGRAVARFAAGESELVLGGTFRDLAVARAAGLPGGALRFDPAAGLFGFVLLRRDGPLADPAVRAALSLALDRPRILAALGAPADSLTAPIQQQIPRASTPLAEHALRVAMPDGPGATLLFRLVQSDWARIGVAVERVEPGRRADLALIDQVVPAGERARFACAAAPGCDPADPLALFVPIAAPIRWSLVAPGLSRFTPNALAAHPLDRLR